MEISVDEIRRIGEQLLHLVGVTDSDHDERPYLAAPSNDLIYLAKREYNTNRLSIACGPAVIDCFIPNALLALDREHPGATVEAETLPPDLAVERLVHRRAQLLLYHEDSMGAFAARRDLTVRRVVSEPYHLLCVRGHPAAAERDFAALLEHDWAVAGFDPAFAANLDPARREMLQRAGFPRFRLSSQNACIQLAKGGRAVTMVPRSAAISACQDGALVSKEIPGVAPLVLTAVTLADAVNPLAEKMICAIASHH